MSMPPYSFGSVLYDELEQVAVRRGGFASLKSLRADVVSVKNVVNHLEVAGRTPAVCTRWLRTESDKVARDAEDVLQQVTDAARSINELGQVVRTRCETAKKVVDKIRKPVSQPSRPVAFHSLLSMLREISSLMQTPSDPAEWETKRDTIRAEIENLAAIVKAAQRKFDDWTGRKEQNAPENEGPVAQAREAGEQFMRLCRLARAFKASRTLNAVDSRRANEARSLLSEDFNERDFEEQVLRGAVIQRARSLDLAADSALGQLNQIIEAYCSMAKTSVRIVRELNELIKDQSDASRYELYDIIEDGATRGHADGDGRPGVLRRGYPQCHFQSGHPPGHGLASTAESVRLPLDGVRWWVHRCLVCRMGPPRGRTCRRSSTPFPARHRQGNETRNREEAGRAHSRISDAPQRNRGSVDQRGISANSG